MAPNNEIRCWKAAAAAFGAIASFALVVAGCTVGDTSGTREPGDEGGPDAGAGGGGGPQLPPSGTPTLLSVHAGDFAPLPDYAGAAFAGRAQMVRTVDNRTIVDVTLTGLTPNTEYPAHVHALPCSVLGGGHYMMDPLIEEVLPSNEIWPMFTTNEEGIGKGVVEVSHLARGDALSVVVHDAVGTPPPKMACADLKLDDPNYIASGSFAPFSAAEAIDQNIAGTASLEVVSGSTVVTIDVTGLDPASIYKSHVHAYPCGVNEAGGHYKINPLEEQVLEINELWPVIEDHLDGSATYTLNNDLHEARYDAQSVVIHREDGELNPKVACADLSIGNMPEYDTAGEVGLLPDGQGSGIAGTANMIRRLDGITGVTMSVTGLEAGKDYSVHVHDLPCSVSSGGGHYRIDPAITDAVEDNEMWLTLSAGDDGSAKAVTYAEHTARAEAQSLVIHGDEGVRVGCIDLE